MPTYEYHGLKAQEMLRNNPMARWHRAGADVDDSSGPLAVQRMKQPCFQPLILPAFSIGRRDRIFAIGSCFARGIEKVLIHKKLRVESAASEFDAFELQRPDVSQLGFTNKYTTASICNELGWALDPSRSYPEDAFVQFADNEWVDPHTNPTLKYVDLERTRERRRIMSEVVSRIKQCRVVIITLGLIETWFDHQTGLYLNMTPLERMLRREPQRFVFHVLDYDENRRNLHEIHRLLNLYGHPQAQIVVTVSPVPLKATFSHRDVVVANSYSKSLLRTVAEEWSAAHENVHYFPSYEIALHSHRDVVWTEDGRHVQGEMTQHIMRLFVKAYLKKPLSRIFARK